MTYFIDDYLIFQLTFELFAIINSINIKTPEIV